MCVRIFSHFEALPPSYDKLFEQGAAESFCLTRWWFEHLALETLDDSERIRLIGVENDEPEPLAMALFVGVHRERDASASGARSFSGLSNYYSMIFAPLVAESADTARILGCLVKAICTRRPSYDVLRFQPLDPASPLFDALQNALRGAGQVVQPYFHCGNRYERTAGTNSMDYLAVRPATLRNTIRRKGHKLLKNGARVEIITDGRELERGIADYERVYAGSWKRADPYPGVMRALARSCVAKGALRLGLLYLDGGPIAAQIWIVWSGKATLYKLAHDRRFDRLSPGTVLTMGMMKRVIDVDRVAEIDFGVGDDPFKGDWASERRERWGLVAFNPGTVRGALGAFRHVGASKVKRVAAKYFSAESQR